MKRIILILGILALFGASNVMAGSNSVVLADNVLVTKSNVLKCMAHSDTETKIVFTGAATDTFAIVEDGAAIVTVTLTETTEVWTKTGGILSFKVNWTAVAGSPAATLYCYKPE